MIGKVEIKCTAHHPQMPLQPVFSFKGSPSSLRLMDIPKKISQWDINRVYIKVLSPNNETTITDCVRSGSVWVGTFKGCDIVGKVSQGIEVLADGIDENGVEIEGYVLGVGDYIVMDKNQDIKAQLEKYSVKFLDELPISPSKGDIVIYNGSVQLFDGEKWVKCSDEEAIERIDAEIEAINEDISDIKQDAIALEGKVEVLENDIKEISDEIPTKTSELENDSGYITIEDVPEQSEASLYLIDDKDEATKRLVLDNDGKVKVQKLVKEGWNVKVTSPGDWFISLDKWDIEDDDGDLWLVWEGKVQRLPDGPIENWNAYTSNIEATHFVPDEVEYDGGYVDIELDKLVEPTWQDASRIVADDDPVLAKKLSDLVDDLNVATYTDDTKLIFKLKDNAQIKIGDDQTLIRDSGMEIGGNGVTSSLVMKNGDGMISVSPNLKLLGSREKGKSQIIVDDDYRVVITPKDTVEGQTLKAILVEDEPTSEPQARMLMTRAGEKTYHIEWEATDLPSKTSDLTNDSGYITIEDVPEQSTTTFRTWED